MVAINSNHNGLRDRLARAMRTSRDGKIPERELRAIANSTGFPLATVKKLAEEVRDDLIEEALLRR